MMSDYSDNSQNKMSFNGLVENFECKECKKTFKYDSHYKRHIQTHSDSRPFECEICKKKFKRQDALKTHERTHSDDLPFKCSHEGCVEGFASKAALRYHELRHTNETIFICDKDGCNKKFLTLGQLKQHQRTKIHAKSSVGGGSQMYGDQESYNNAQPHHNNGHSLSNSGNLSTNSGYNQNQIYYNNAAAPNIQFSQPQHFYNIQNSASPNFLYSNNANLIQNMSEYLSNENLAASTNFSSNSHVPSSNNITTPATASYQYIKVKKEHRQEGTFLDDFSEDEQVFIDQIWSTIKQEGSSNEFEGQTKRHEEFNESCNNNYHNEYPIQKRRRNNPVQSENKVEMSSSTSNLLMEFTRFNSSGYSFSRLKQELRIIVGLIDKIKKEDEEIVPPAPSEEDNQDYNNFSSSPQNSQQKNNSTPSNSSKNSNKSKEEQDYHFYQNDESPFHNYECQYIHENLPSEVIDKFESKEDQMNINGYCKSSDRPLLKKKIKTAVRLVQYCKKAFIEQKKQQIQTDQQQAAKKRISIQAQSVQPAQFNFNPKYEQSQSPQQFEINSQFSQQSSNNNNNYQPISIPVEDYYPQNYQQQSKNNLFNQNLVKNHNGYSTSSYNTQPSLIQQGVNQYSQNNTFTASASQSNNLYTPTNNSGYSFEPYRMQQQQMIIGDGAPICISSLNNTLVDDSQRNLSDVDSNLSSDHVGNIFDAADELQNNQMFNEEFINMNQFLPAQQFNTFRYAYEQR